MNMNHIRCLLGCLVVASTLLTAVPSYADIPPPDSCTSVGAVCANAGVDADRPGVCTMATCSRPTPGGSVTYDCLRCIAGGGAGGAGGTGGATTEGGSGGEETDPTGGTASATGGANSTGGAAPSSGGKSASGGTMSTTGGQAGASGAAPKNDDDGGCSVSPVGAERGVAALLAALGLSALFVARRRR